MMRRDPEAEQARLLDAYVKSVREYQSAAQKMAQIAGNPGAMRAFKESMLVVECAKDRSGAARKALLDYRHRLKAQES